MRTTREREREWDNREGERKVFLLHLGAQNALRGTGRGTNGVRDGLPAWRSLEHSAEQRRVGVEPERVLLPAGLA